MTAYVEIFTYSGMLFVQSNIHSYSLILDHVHAV